jgi:hypothetical protein
MIARNSLLNYSSKLTIATNCITEKKPDGVFNDSQEQSFEL